MGKIIELNDHVRNMIAAGEVVERPLNVVKELVENSIDANSSVITINLLDSGLRKIEVIDNGDGMDEEDALKSFRRHATSKLKNEHDLYRISTLGFRGEAIPSIAAVSEFVLKTKKENTDGVEIIVKGSKFISKNTIAINKGTHISVNNLFYNTPARLKYMKSPNVELSYIVDIVEKIALSYPNISFKLTNNNQVLVQTSISNKIDKKICEIYNIETFKNMLYFEDDFDNTYIKAFISNSNLYKSKRNDITLIVNNRIVKNTSIISRVVEAYEGFIPVSKYPICVIYIDIDPLLVDVNVSPSKTLVKFSNEEILLEKLYENIVKTLKESLYKKIVDTNEKVDYTKIERTIKTKQEIVNDVKEEYTLIDLFQNEVETTKNENIEIKNDKPEVVKKIPYMEYIGQLMGTYLLFQNEEGLYLFDQHACEEKINYENIIKRLEEYNHNQKIELLIPFNLDFSKKEYFILKDNLDKLNELGFVLEENINNGFIIREIPLWLKGFDVKEAIEDVLYYLINNKKFSIIDFKDEIAKMIACKKSIKANHYINKLEVDTLIERLNKLDNPFTCPHGRPSIVKLTTYEIEKLFKRIV